MKKLFTLSVLLVLGLITVQAQQWANTGSGPWNPSEVFVIGNTLHTFGLLTDYESSNNGDIWTKDSLLGMGTYPSIVSFDQSGNNYFAGDPYGKIYKSSDGINWTLNYNMGSSVPIPYILADGNNLYAVTDGAGVLYSTDGGGNWHLGNSGLLSNGGVNVYQIVKVGSDLFITTLKGVYKSTDGGASWVLKTNGMSSANLACVGIAYTGGALLASSSGGGLYRSVDLGENWTQITNGFNGFINLGTIYTYGNLTVVGGLLCKAYYSTDAGLSWTLIGQGVGFGSTQFSDFVVFNGNLYTASTGYCMKVALSALGITGIPENNIQQNNFSVYPNPATSQLFIETNGIPVTEINIYSTTGSLVSQTTLPQTKSIDISQLATGVYLTEIKTTQGWAKRRWVKM